jgi:tryptophan-rich hypothetical protein
MNRFNPKKLLNSKWTAAQPEHKELHFIVIKLIQDEDEAITGCVLEAVLTKNGYKLTLAELKNTDKWIIGWK